MKKKIIRFNFDFIYVNPLYNLIIVNVLNIYYQMCEDKYVNHIYSNSCKINVLYLLINKIIYKIKYY